jgi:hypothetical protein
VDTKENQNERKPTLCNTACSARIQGFRAVLSLEETKRIALEEVDRAGAEREDLAVAAAR